MTAPFDAVVWPVLAQRLLIRPARQDDLDATWSIRRLEPVARWIGAAPQTREEFAEKFLDPARLETTLVYELDDRVIGDLFLEVQDMWAQTEVASQAKDVQAEIGWTIDPASSGHGYATEAVTALLRICFEQLGLRRVIALCFADNEASWRLMERLHMRRETHAVRESLHRSGDWLDSYTYALLADEWRAERRRDSNLLP